MISNFVEDFLDIDSYEKAFNSIKLLNDNDKDHTFNTHLETMKTVFKSDVFIDDIKQPMNLLGGKKGKDLIREMTGWSGKMFSLLEFDGFGGYCPLHQMHKGGYLHPHVDHSFIQKGKYIHIGNCILYMNKTWKNDWGGATTFYKVDSQNLFNYFALPVESFYPIGNSVLSFVHDSFAFHGVSDVRCPSNQSRYTYYMDYYISSDDLYEFCKSFRDKNLVDFKFAKHSTTFLPFPIEINGKYKFFSNLNRETITYIRRYLNYLERLNNSGLLVKPYYLSFFISIFNRFLVILDILLSNTLKPIIKPIYRKYFFKE
tara:strand:+ start:11136 stop:12080 length:945 start_codon:yes stop_codon:yes gene_type:complete